MQCVACVHSYGGLGVPTSFGQEYNKISRMYLDVTKGEKVRESLFTLQHKSSFNLTSFFTKNFKTNFRGFQTKTCLDTIPCSVYVKGLENAQNLSAMKR